MVIKGKKPITINCSHFARAAHFWKKTVLTGGETQQTASFYHCWRPNLFRCLAPNLTVPPHLFTRNSRTQTWVVCSCCCYRDKCLSKAGGKNSSTLLPTVTKFKTLWRRPGTFDCWLNKRELSNRPLLQRSVSDVGEAWSKVIKD